MRQPFLEHIKTEKGKKVFFSMIFLSLSVVFLLAGYSFVRSPAESLLIFYFGAAKKPYAMALVPVAMGILIYGYGYMLSKVGSKRAVLYSMGTSMIFFLVIYTMLKARMSSAAFLLYLFKEAYIVILVEQVWSFVNSIETKEEANFYNGPIAGMGAFGPMTADFLIGKYSVAFTTENFVLLASLTFVPCIVFMWLAYRFAGEPQPSREEAGGARGHLHLSLLKENKTVFFIALVIFCTQIVSTLLDLRFTQLVQDNIKSKDLRTSYFGHFWLWVNAFSFFMQFLLTPVIMRKISIKIIQIAIPLVHVANCILLFIYPSLSMAAAAFFVFKGIDYSLFRASKETLYIPFSYDTRYRAKQVADAFTYRFSKGFTATVISTFSFFSSVSGSLFSLFAAFFAGVWAVLSVPMTKVRK